MPGTIRRGSKSKSPIIISEQLPETGLIGDTDFEDLKKLDCLSIEFSHAEGMPILQELIRKSNKLTMAVL